jgi:hypothetical protein
LFKPKVLGWVNSNNYCMFHSKYPSNRKKHHQTQQHNIFILYHRPDEQQPPSHHQNHQKIIEKRYHLRIGAETSSFTTSKRNHRSIVSFALQSSANSMFEDGADHDENDDDDDDDASYKIYLQLQRQKHEKHFKENLVPPWLLQQTHLPFSCTSCGRCCQTNGSVYMNSNEVQIASQYLNISKQLFIQQYTAVTRMDIVDDNNKTSHREWIQLKDDIYSNNPNYEHYQIR